MHRFLVLTLVAAFGFGCSSSPDVLATGQTQNLADGGSDGAPILITDPVTNASCEPGQYRGNFWGTLGVEPNLTAFSGSISFELVPVLLREFFLIQNSSLDGSSEDGVDIRANVTSDPGAACREGQFDARLEDGVYGNPDTGFPFYGEVSGTYSADELLFRGEWRTFAAGTDPEVEVGRGQWLAVHTESY